MAKLIRCPAGHVYDKEAHEACPECAKSGVVSKAVAAMGAADGSEEQRKDGGGDKKASSPPWIAIGGGAVLLLAGLGFFLFKPSGGDGHGGGEKPAAEASTSSGIVSVDQALADPDFAACRKTVGDDMEACERSITSKKFAGSALAALISSRGAGKAKKGDYAAGIADQTEAIKIDPNLATAYNNRGVMLRAQGKPDDALKDFDEAIKLDPKAPLAFLNRGGSYFAKGDYDRAIADADEVVKLDPKLFKGYSQRGGAYAKKGDKARAKADFEQALALNPDEATKKVLETALSGVTDQAPSPSPSASPSTDTTAEKSPAESAAPAPGPAAASSSTEAAAASPSTAVSAAPATTAQATPAQSQSDPQRSDPAYLACAKPQDGTDGIAACDQALASGKFTGVALYNLYVTRGAWKNKKEDFDGAIADNDEAVKLDATKPMAFANRGTIYLRKNEAEKGLADLEQALKLDPKYPPALYRRGGYYAGKRDYDRAIQDFSGAIDGEPNNSSYYKNRGDAYRRKGDRILASADYQKALTLNPDPASKKQIDAALYALGSAPPSSPSASDASPSSAPAQATPSTAPAESSPSSAPAQATPSAAQAGPSPESAALDDDARRYHNNCLAGSIEACNLGINSGKFSGSSLSILYNNRGLARQAKNDLDGAVADQSEAIRLEPTATSFTNRGNVKFLQGKYDAAIEDYDAAIKLNPNGLYLMFERRGIANTRKGDYDAAIKDFSEEIGVSPDYAWGYGNRAYAYWKKGDRERASEDYKSLLALTNLTDDYRKTIEKFSSELASGGNPSSEPELPDDLKPVQQASTPSPASASTAADSTPSSPPAEQKAAEAAKPPAETPAAQPAPDAKPSEPSATTKADPVKDEKYAEDMAEICEESMEYDDETLAGCDDAIASGKFSGARLGTLHYQRGVIREDKGDIDGAFADFSDSIKADDHPASRYHRGLIFKKRDEKEKAAADFKLALERNPTGLLLKDIERALKSVQPSAPSEASQTADAKPQPTTSTADPKTDPDYQACEKRDQEACSRAIASSKYAGLDLSALYRFRGYAKKKAEKPDLDAALADYTEAIKLYPDNFIAYALRGDVYIAKKDWAPAIKDFDRVIELNPDAGFYNSRGHARRRSGDPGGAIKDFDKSIELGPNDPLTYWNRGLAYQDKGDKESAVADYKKALTLDPDEAMKKNIEGSLASVDAEALAASAGKEATAAEAVAKTASAEQAADPMSDPDFKACAGMGDGKLDACTRAIESGKFSGKSLSVLYNNRSGAKFYNSGSEAALPDLEKAIEINPNYAPALSSRGLARLEKGELEAALEDLNKAISIDPHPITLAIRGRTYAAMGNFDRAVVDLSEAIKGAPNERMRASFIWSRADAYKGKGDKEKAKADYEQALSLATNEDTKKKIQADLKALESEPAPTPAKSEEKSGDVEAKEKAAQSDPDYNSCVDRKDENAGAACNKVIDSGKYQGPVLAALYLARGRMPANLMPGKNKNINAAIGDFTKAIELDPTEVYALIARAGNYILVDKYDLGLKDADEAIKLSPKNSAAHHFRGFALVEKGELDAAIEAFDQALALNDQLVMSYFYRARAYTEKGNPEHAIADYKKALALNPDESVKKLIGKKIEALEKAAAKPNDKKSEADQPEQKSVPPSQQSTSLFQTGLYRLSGSNPDGGKFYGQVAVIADGDKFTLKSWSGKTHLTASGTMSGNEVALQWSDGVSVTLAPTGGALEGKSKEGDVTERFELFAAAGTGPGTLAEGTYNVAGSSIEGDKPAQPYEGTATMVKQGENYKISWKVGTSSYDGTGKLADNIFTVAWDSPSPVVYAVTAGGVLKGLWDSGFGEETMTPQTPSSPSSAQAGGGQ